MNFRQVYIAGAYTSDEPRQRMRNIYHAMQAGATILATRGWLPIVPHCSMSHETDWEPAMDRCRKTIRAMVPGRDVLVLLPGWESSRGAAEERELAIELGLEVATLAEALR